jgi:hypothetical protein
MFLRLLPQGKKKATGILHAVAFSLGATFRMPL